LLINLRKMRATLMDRLGSNNSYWGSCDSSWRSKECDFFFFYFFLMVLIDKWKDYINYFLILGFPSSNCTSNFTHRIIIQSEKENISISFIYLWKYFISLICNFILVLEYSILRATILIRHPYQRVTISIRE